WTVGRTCASVQARAVLVQGRSFRFEPSVRQALCCAASPASSSHWDGRRGFCVAAAPSDAEAMELYRRRKQLLFRAKSRGWLELDVLMGTFAEKVVWDYDHANLDLLDEVLELENPDLFKWFTGQAAVPEEIKQNEVMVKMLEYVKTDQTGGFGPAARSM
ncbi:unnamed protein product, partial [Polarella glacialis]